MKWIYVLTRMKGQGSPELALENREETSEKNDNLHIFYTPGTHMN